MVVLNASPPLAGKNFNRCFLWMCQYIGWVMVWAILYIFTIFTAVFIIDCLHNAVFYPAQSNQSPYQKPWTIEPIFYAFEGAITFWLAVLAGLVGIFFGTFSANRARKSHLRLSTALVAFCIVTAIFHHLINYFFPVMDIS